MDFGFWTAQHQSTKQQLGIFWPILLCNNLLYICYGVIEYVLYKVTFCVNDQPNWILFLYSTFLCVYIFTFWLNFVYGIVVSYYHRKHDVIN